MTICTHCRQLVSEHAGLAKCLFMPTEFEPIHCKICNDPLHTIEGVDVRRWRSWFMDVNDDTYYHHNCALESQKNTR